MKITGILFSICILCFFFFFLLTSCLSGQRVDRENNMLPKAYWNQAEHDQAMYKIHQPRNLILTVSIRHDETYFPERIFRVYKGREKYGSEEEFIDITLDKNGITEQKINYNHSFIGIEFSPALFGVTNGIDTAFFAWYTPGTWVKELIVDIDITHFSSRMFSNPDNGTVHCDFLYNPEWIEKKVWVSFERLFTLTSTSEEHPDGLSAREGIVERKERGIMTILLNMPGFFNKWNKNYSKPWQEGDIFPVSLTLTLTPPARFFRTVPSRRQDPPFVPRKYNGKVNASEGDPYLFIPSTDLLEEAIIEMNINIPVTGVMLM